MDTLGPLDNEERPFTFIKWFISVATTVMLIFMLFVFNQTIQNQTGIHQALTELKGVKENQRNQSTEIDAVSQKIDDLSRDPIHGWGERWPRSEAEREIKRLEHSIARVESQFSIHQQRKGHTGIRIEVTDMRNKIEFLTRMLEATYGMDELTEQARDSQK